MTDPAEQPDDATDNAEAADSTGDGSGAQSSDDAALQHAHEVGTAMVEQLGVLLDRWLVQITELVDNDIDPAPLLRGLARLMHSAADQLDPDTETPAPE